jgi:hypothetical protein
MHRVRTVIRHYKALFALAATLTVTVPRASAQATLIGFVRGDSSSVPLRQAEVAIPWLHLRSYADSAGRFRIDNIKAGEYEVIVRQLGFAPFVTRMVFQDNETTAQQFELTPVTTVLAKVNVVAPDTARSLAVDNAIAFEKRRQKGFGSFITQSELYAARERAFTTVLHTIPQVRFYRINGAMVAGSEQSGRRCLSQVYLDGTKIYWAFDLNTITPSSLRGVEFYPSVNAPSEFSAGPDYCGVLILWTRLKNQH